ncbi:MAG: DUF4350 domain-containing protein [Gammaproteobacteria bacterium]|nr:DUF4350 domain-containing protein [Gammaproteobacteria bacterium]
MRSKIPLIITLVVIFLSTYVFFKLFEQYEENKDLGWDKKALRNPYLAAEQFLLKNKINVTSSNNFEKLTHLPEQGMIFISDSRKVLTKKRVASILDWLEKGGHLIITAPVYNKNNPSVLLSRFKVKNILREKEDEEDEEDSDVSEKKLSEKLNEINEDLKKEKTKSKDEHIIPESEITYLSFTNIKEKLKINFSSNSSLSHPYLYSDNDYKKTELDPTYWAGNEKGTYFMQFEVGEGLLSIITDNGIWRSSSIDELDHAYLLWVLGKNNSEVVLLYGASMPSIFYYMWQHASELIVAFSLWLFAWLFYRSRRFGKIFSNSDFTARSISEHISASSEYLWRNRKFEQLIEPVRNDIFKQINRLYPYFNNLKQAEQVKLISNHSKIELNKVNIALIKPFNGNENEFTRIISYLQKIRNSL